MRCERQGGGGAPAIDSSKFLAVSSTAPALATAARPARASALIIVVVGGGQLREQFRREVSRREKDSWAGGSGAAERGLLGPRGHRTEREGTVCERICASGRNAHVS